MKSVPLGMVVVAAATGLLGFLPSSRAQDDGTPPAAISHALGASVDYGNDAAFQPEKFGVEFGLLGVRPEQPVAVSIQFPTESAGQSVAADALDGGTVTVPEGGLIVGADGVVTFQFQTSILGACRVNVHLSDDENFIRFWVVNLEWPESNPPNLPGAY